MTDRADEWRDRAACRGTDPELFFPSTAGAGAQRLQRQAKAICATCPVLADCLSWALTEGIDFGVFGGLDADERRALRRNLPLQPTGSQAVA